MKKLVLKQFLCACCLPLAVFSSAEAAQHGKSQTKKKTANHQVQAKVKAKKTLKLAKVSKKSGHKKIAVAKALQADDKPSAGDLAGLNHTPDPLELKSNVAFVVDQQSSKVLFEKNAEVSLPIASITKLMTSLVVVEAKQSMDDMLEITDEDIDKEKNTHSRLKIGSRLSRSDLLHIALMSSENRAASALGRNYPGGIRAFVAAMNAKARQLGMQDTHYVDSSGLSSQNRASARDLVRLVNAAYQHPLIRQYSTDTKYVVESGGRPIEYGTSNKLVEHPEWDIGLQKTGYISEAGRCLVMQAIIKGRAIIMVFLDSKGKYSRLGDAGRIKKWLETSPPGGQHAG